MFPLAGKEFPTSAEALATSIREALAEVMSLPRGDATVVVEGGVYPAVDRLRVDLSGARIRVAQPPPPPKPAGPRQPGIVVARLEVLGHPILYEQSSLDGELTAVDVRLDFARDEAGRPLLILADAGDGRAEVHVTKADLRSMLQSAASAAAKAQGVTIQDVQIDLTNDGDRAVAVDVRVKAKKFMMSGGVRLTGRAEIGDGPAATLSRLNCTGDGMVGGMAAGFVQGKLKEYEGRTVPLTALSFGDAHLRDLKIDATGPMLHVTAAFGK